MQPGGRLLEPADHPQGRRLAAARRAEEAEELAVAHLEVDVVDGEHVAERLRHLDEPDVDIWHVRAPRIRASAEAAPRAPQPGHARARANPRSGVERGPP